MEIAKRTPNNCDVIKQNGNHGTDGDGKCMGFGRAWNDDEPCEECKKCRYCTSYEEEAENE